MDLRWTDVREIAIALSETHPEVDPLTLRFTTLRDLVCALEGFSQGPDQCNEKILETIQQLWIEDIS